MWVLEFMGSTEDLSSGDSKWHLRKPVSPARLWIAHLWLWHYKKYHLPLLRLLFPSSFSFLVHKEEIQRLCLLIPFHFDNNTTPDPETLLPSHSLKVLQKPRNFKAEINVFNCKCLSSIYILAEWARMSPFGSFSQVICFFLVFIMPLMQSRATDYKEAVWLQQ